jgi:probable F420-dependent oxidoreductase
MSAAPRPDRRLRTGIVPLTPFTSLDDWRARVRAVDEQGHDVLLMADHVGMVAPLPPLVAAAAVSERLRFGVQVLNNEFWNPVLLAREAATADILTAGRLELGFGAGHAAVEFAAAGLAYDRPRLRIDRLAAAVPLVRTLLAGGTVDVDATYGLEAASLGFAAAQPGIPVMVGGNGDRVLRLAAEQADIVGLTGFTSGTGRTHTDLSHFTWDGLADRIDHVRRHAGERFADLELSVLVQAVRRSDDRRAMAVEFAQGMIEDVGALLDSPFLLLGTDDERTAQVARLRDEMGVTYVTTFEPGAEALAAAVAPLR